MEIEIVSVEATDSLNVGGEDSASIRVKSSFELVWARIAFQQTAVARDARAEVMRIGSDREFNAGLVAICAASFALDALYDVLGSMVVTAQLRETWKQNETARRRRVFETFRRALHLGADEGRWAREIKELFSLRDSAVHFHGEFQVPVMHPTGTRVGVELHKYSADQASRFTSFLAEVFDTVISQPRPAVAKWAAEAASGFSVVAERLP